MLKSCQDAAGLKSIIRFTLSSQETKYNHICRMSKQNWMSVVWEDKEPRYVSNTNSVLHNVQEEDEEYILSYHIENLAISFVRMIY